MPVLTMGPVDEGFLLSEAPGFRSRDTRTLKTGGIYQPGSVVIAEHVDDDGYEPTGVHILATAAAIAAYGVPAAALDAAIVCRRTDATDASTVAAVIDADAEVKDDELIVGADTDLDDVAEALAVKGIKIRRAI